MSLHSLQPHNSLVDGLPEGSFENIQIKISVFLKKEFKIHRAQAADILVSHCCEDTASSYCTSLDFHHYKYFSLIFQGHTSLGFLVLGRSQRAVLLKPLILGELQN